MNVDTSQIKAHIVFSGCGGMYSYKLGIASVIQENYDLSNVIVSCVSAGCFPGLALMLNLNILEYFDIWNIEFLKEVNSYLFGSIGVFNNIAKKWTLKFLNRDKDIYKKAISRFFCSITTCNFFNKPHLENMLISNWKSNEDLVDGVMSSSFIPLFDIGKLTSSYRNKSCIDGTITNNEPNPYPELDIPKLVISYDMFNPAMKKSWYLVWVWSSPKWSRYLFELGRKDTLENLDKLDKIKFLKKNQPTQIKQLFSKKIKPKNNSRFYLLYIIIIIIINININII